MKPQSAVCSTAQVDAWNSGDVVTFMHGYKDSPSTTFVGKTVQHGYADILARYQKSFAGKEKMGQLTFSELEVHQLDAHFATVTGRFHLARSAAGGGDAAGIFSLIFEKTRRLEDRPRSHQLSPEELAPTKKSASPSQIFRCSVQRRCIHSFRQKLKRLNP